jgi:hypothetical protein
VKGENEREAGYHLLAANPGGLIKKIAATAINVVFHNFIPYAGIIRIKFQGMFSAHSCNQAVKQSSTYEHPYALFDDAKIRKRYGMAKFFLSK